ncbi:cytochrome P450 [Lanmaoa asiatica]|nr:cytochrome P450 [Lanmaoa asiatica]
MIFLARAQRFLDNAYRWNRLQVPSAQPGMFQFRFLHEWRVIVYDKKAIADFLDSNILQFLPMVGDIYQFGYTVHPSLGQNPDIHRPYLRYIMSHLDEFLPDMMKEIELTLGQKHSENNGQFVVMDCMTEAVFRALNVILVGPHLARDPVFRQETLKAVQSILGTGTLLKLSPGFARPFLHKLFKLFMPSCAKSHAMMIEEIRRRKSEVAKEQGQWDSHGIDVLSEFARDNKLIDDENMLAFHFIVLNLAGSFSTIMTLTNVIFDLIEQEGCRLRIREELCAAILDQPGTESDITASMLASCPTLDEFLKESLRLCNLGVLHITRRAARDFTFSNGVRIPAGTSLSVPVGWTHGDPDIYPNPETFDSSRFRFASSDGDYDQAGVHPESNPSNLDPNLLFFGYGKHACPGRFLAIRIVKCLVAHLILNYDIKWAHVGFAPRPMWVMYYCVPDPRAEAVISKRDRKEVQG